MKSVISNAQAPLLRAVQRLLVAALAYHPGCSAAIIVESADSEDWASATFVGQRHRLELRLELRLEADRGGVAGGDHRDSRDLADERVARATLLAAVADLGETIGEADIGVPGHFVAEIAVVSIEQLSSGAVQLTLEALTLLD